MTFPGRALIQGACFAALVSGMSGPAISQVAGTGGVSTPPDNTASVSADPASRIAEARKALDDNLFDFSTTKLRNVRLVSAPAGFEAFCGEINTTNRMGGYSGWQRFIIPLGDTPFGNLMDKVSIAGQRSAAASFFARYGSGASPSSDFNSGQIASHCDKGTPIDEVDYATTLAFKPE